MSPDKFAGSAMRDLSGANPKKVLLLGSTGTIGKSTLSELVARGHEVVCFARPSSTRAPAGPGRPITVKASEAEFRYGDVTDPRSLREAGFRGERFDALVSCLASRTGAPADAWAIDHAAHSQALRLAQDAGVQQMVLLSAICVQKPLLAFQQAKLAFEQELIASGLTYSIVRPTAFFKSLSGQVRRVQSGKPFVVFGDGRLTACKPISDADLATYLADCLDDTALQNQILPIGGPGPAISPRDQGEQLFALLGQKARFRQVPVRVLSGVQRTLALLGRASPSLAEKAELAQIGHYYATESMLVLDPETRRFDADATPSTGTETLFEFYARLLRGETAVDLGKHAVF